MSDPGSLRERRPRQKRALDADCRPIMAELVRLGAAEHHARSVAVRLWNRCREASLPTLQRYIKAGWTPMEIVEHHQQNEEAWRQPPDAIFAAEQNLIQAGLSEKLARRAVILHPIVPTFDPEAVVRAIQSYRDAGIREEDLREMALRHPRALITDPEFIRAWRIVHGPLNRGINSFYALTSGRFNKGSREKAALIPASENAIPSPPPPRKAKREPEVDPEDAETEETEDREEHVRYWQRDIARILQIAEPIEDSEKASARHRALSWIWDGTTSGKQVLDELTCWVSLPRAISTSSSETKTLQFFAKLFLDETLHAFLRLSPTVVKYRLHILRRFILGKTDIVDVPTFLSLPWETLREPEIRYRINVLADKNLQPHKKLVLRALLEPDRAVFQRKIETISQFR